MSEPKQAPAVRWLPAPEEHDYPAAASYLSLIAPPDTVEALVVKLRTAVPLSPILVVRGDLASDGRLEIADGHHRVCACYHADESTDIPCLVVDR